MRSLPNKVARKRKGDKEDKTDKDESQVKKAKVTPPSVSSSLIVSHLVSSDQDQVISALATLASSDQDKLEEFFAGGGNVTHLLHLLDTAESKVKANDIAAVFNAVEGVINHVVRWVSIIVFVCR